MFTGIIEEVGALRRKMTQAPHVFMTFEATRVLQGTSKGGSIAVNGACLTVLGKTLNSFTAALMKETLKRCNLGKLQPGNRVNLERAMAANGRLDGHIVTGHIDDMGVVERIDHQGSSVLMSIKATDGIMQYLVEKGSVALNGVSLTVVDLDANNFRVALLPYTLNETNLGLCKVGDRVNLEADILAKYAEKSQIQSSAKDSKAFQSKKTSQISWSFLEEHGYL